MDLVIVVLDNVLHLAQSHEAQAHLIARRLVHDAAELAAYSMISLLYRKRNNGVPNTDDEEQNDDAKNCSHLYIFFWISCSRK